MSQLERKIPLVTVGGTFDVLHKGHWFLLEEAFSLANKVLIGLTTDEFVERMAKSHPVDCYCKRLGILEEFLEKRDLLGRAEVVPLDDMYGPTVGDRPMVDVIDGVLVSEETEPGAEEINRRRVEEGKKPLLIIVVTMVLADDGRPISTTRIRQQEVDRFGRLIG
jgi:pantetheine-phosphate adenylyltransferase